MAGPRGGETRLSRHSLLLVEDEASVRFSIGRFFGGKGFEVRQAETAAAALLAYRQARPDAVILDYCLPDQDGLDLMRALREVDASVPIVILTAHSSIDLAVRAIKEGAEQFLTKPVELQALLVVIERVLQHERNRQVSLARKTRQERRSVDPFVGDSPAIKRLAEQARRLLSSSSPILIQGETGTGKGLLASWLYQNGARVDEAFVDLNCAGLSREFLESELFGHERGAFTGAVNAKPGLIEIAHRGTLFLDEIGDVDPQVQPKLLKVLEDQRFRRLGDVRDRQVDVHLIAATHRDLLKDVRAERFRADLYYRISTLLLSVPPLRERGRDIVSLARALLERIAADLGRPGVRLSGEAERVIERYGWPGNVRELRNVLERAVLLGEGEALGGSDLQGQLAPSAGTVADRQLTLREAERRHIEAVLGDQGGDVSAAAGVLGLSRSALYQRVRNLGIVVPRG